MDEVQQINRRIADALEVRNFECDAAEVAYRRETLLIGDDAATKRYFERADRACAAFRGLYTTLTQRRAEIEAAGAL